MMRTLLSPAFQFGGESCINNIGRTTSHVMLVFSIILTIVLSKDITNACDQNFISTTNIKSKNGSFHAPTFLNPEGHVRQCTFNFRALPNERVQIHFEEFNLQGTPPECFHEHLDIFTEIEKPDTQPLIETPFGGRFCGQNAPRERISLYQSLSMVFLSDRENVTDTRFMGYYEFIPDDKYTKIGVPDGQVEGKSSLCTFQIHGSKFKGKNKTGELFSPTYPGTYPKNIKCGYKFIGDPGQRIRLEFRDFDLFYGGAHCPFDRMTIYDGPDNLAEKIGTYCGQMRNLVVFSTKNLLYVTFTTLKRTAQVFNRGFFGLYDFSEEYVKLDFIQNSDAEHIRGTECDQKILSKKESSGQVFSPNYPFPYQSFIVCRYFIYGMQDSQNLERVVLTFDKFDIPMLGKQKNKCKDGYVKVYIQGQEEEHKYDKHDFMFCGQTTPQTINSPGPRLVLLFKAGSKPGSGFKAQYRFETEYQIPGTPKPGSCHFTYRSTSRLEGRFNSPRHPQNYPNQLNCTYLFLATPSQQVQIVFDHFKVRADNINSNSSLGHWKAYGREQCNDDFIEIFDIHTDQSKQLLGRYCDKSSPGPVVSPRGTVGIQLFLHTDNEAVFSGFKGRYNFIPAKNPFGDCGGNITDSENGFIKSPNYPEKYTTNDQKKEGTGYGSLQCHWFIHAKPGHKILLYFDDFEVEGNPSERGCPAAALRVWPWENKEKTPIELCGDTLDSYKQILSETNVLQLSFYLADKAVGAKGFKATWTEIKDLPSCQNQNEFKCRNSSYCISRKLQCNHVRNCGMDDRSDEMDCLQETEFNEFMLVGLGLGISSIVAIGMIIYCRRYKRKKMRRREHPMLPAHSHFHTCESIGERFANSSSMDSV
eukprot:TRINITY_DN23170_c0_g1_i1.p1 TRINITY_DN23170_c0_g1~~TRINITY_DN23170_c0_g1_i1.p1  ORF type:complete len:870 (-),score=100.53 TRINITY_DN23170_c0_g1_i1:1263-3872(-)